MVRKNLLTNYDKYISRTAIYCNDRSIGSGKWTEGYSDEDSNYYAATQRVHVNKTPSYKCGANGSGGLFETTQAVADKFSASTSGGGNGQLTYPIGLITADELAFAGANTETSLTSPYTWFYNNSEGNSIFGTKNWWTMSPNGYNNVFDGFYVTCFSNSNVNGIGINIMTTVNVSYLLRPVISLKACVEWSSGDGSSSNPYQVTISNTCSNSEN